MRGCYKQHTGERLDAHLFVAGLVALHVILLIRRVTKYHAARLKLVRLAGSLGILLLVQLLLGRAGAKNPPLVAHSVELIRARDVADGIALRVLRRSQRWSAFQGDDFETSRSELLRQNAAHSADSNDANISN